MTQNELKATGYTPAEQHLVITAAGYRPSMAGRAVIYCHGAGGIAPIDGPDARVDLELLANYGYVVCCPMAGMPYNWGNDGSRTAIDSCLTYLHDDPALNATVTSPLFIADSMGAPTVLWWAVNNPTRLGKAVLRVPAYSLQTIHDGNFGGLAANMETAYGGAGPLAAAYPTHDANHPTFQANFLTLDIADKFRIMYNAPDPICLEADVLNFADAVGIESIEMGGPSHAPWGYFDVAAQHKWLTT